MRRVLIAWVGKTDLRARTESDLVGIGPIAQALDARDFDEVALISDYPKKETKPFVAWLKSRSAAQIDVVHEALSSPTAFGEIYEAAVRRCTGILGDQADTTQLVCHLSPGTPAMAAVWILLAKTRFPAELLESSREQGVRTAQVPFDIAVDFLPDLLRDRDRRLQQLSGSQPPNSPEFADIIHRSRVMSRLIQRARQVAAHSMPVLLEGPSGTGKELFARAIHRASARRDRAFITVNCGAIPDNLVESELFGHEKGAFSGADRARPGYFEAAGNGTLFLDEIGELPAPAQVKLLRVLQEGEVPASARRNRQRSMSASLRRPTARSPKRSLRGGSARISSIGSRWQC